MQFLQADDEIIDTTELAERARVKGAVNVRAIPTYTGDKIIGIGTMHKSNAVPIFTSEQAQDISKMRRG